MADNVIDLGLDIKHTADIPVDQYWTPEIVRFDDDDNTIAYVITFEENSHKKVFIDAFNNKTKISVKGSIGKNPCFLFTVKDHIIIADTIPESEELKEYMKEKELLFYFYNENEVAGVIRVKNKKK